MRRPSLSGYASAVEWIARHADGGADLQKDRAVLLLANLAVKAPRAIVSDVCAITSRRARVLAAVREASGAGRPPTVRAVSLALGEGWSKTHCAIHDLAIDGEVVVTRRGHGPIRVAAVKPVHDS